MPPTLAERLGYAPDARLLIFNCDDLGSTRAANVAIYEALRDGLATTATIMVPCPWARDAAAMYRGEDVGVHLTLNSEWSNYRWGPITHSPSLLDGDGGFPRTVEDVWDHADLDEVRKECRAQVERAIYWGFDVTHLDSHMGTMQLRPAFFDVYLETALDFGLPLRMAPAAAERLIGFPYRKVAEREGVVFPDHFVYTNVGSRMQIEAAVKSLSPGVTEIYVHPAVDTDELRASHPDWEMRIDDYALVTKDEAFADSIAEAGATLISYRALRDLQRSEQRAAVQPVTPDALAALCSAAMPEEKLTVGELTHLCFGANDASPEGGALPDEIFGDEHGAAVMQTQRFGDHVAAWLVLVAVHPDRQSTGLGKELVSAVIERAREIGAADLLLASAIPRYLWPGVDTANTRAGMLLETLGFERDWVGTNMTIDAAFRRTPPPGVTVERETGSGAHAFAAVAYPYWVPELDRAVGLGTAFAARNADGATIAFACHSVNRAGWIGPMATDPTLQHGGVGSAVLAAVCADLDRIGLSSGEISWVSNLRFYGKCGARVSRVFLGGRLKLATTSE